MSSTTTAASKFFLLAFVASAGSDARAWGERGHHVICEVAARLVKEAGLARYLEPRDHMLGHLCNIPDISWRNLAPEFTRDGNPSHHVDPENIHVSIPDLPLEFSRLLAKYDGKPSARLRRAVNGHEDVGSLWWRADQFFRRALEAATKIPKPKADGPQGAEYDNPVYDMTVAMGIMGHFVGDASMPYHSTADYDGWDVGRGGIHGYYESECVSAMGADLAKKVFEAAHPFRVVETPKSKKSVIERMRAMSLLAGPERVELEKLDKTFAPSRIERKDGKDIKVKAARPAAAEQARIFEPLILRELARSAVQLAEFWEEIYAKSGRPDLSAYRSFRYPLNPDFVPTDYTK